MSWGFLAGFGEAMGKYNLAKEEEKLRKERYAWEHEMKISDLLETNPYGDKDLEELGRRRREILLGEKNTSSALKKIKEDVGNYTEQVNLARQRKTETRQQQQAQRQQEYEAQQQAVQQRYQTPAPVSEGKPVGGFGTTAAASIAAPYVQAAGRKAFQEIPKPQAQMPVPQMYISGDKWTATPESEMELEEYKMGRAADIALDKDIRRTRALNEEKFVMADRMGDYLKENQQRFGLTDDDVRYAEYAILTGQRHPGLERSEGFQLSPPFICDWPGHPYYGKQVRMAIVNRQAQPNMLFPVATGYMRETQVPDPATGEFVKGATLYSGPPGVQPYGGGAAPPTAGGARQGAAPPTRGAPVTGGGAPAGGAQRQQGTAAVPNNPQEFFQMLNKGGSHRATVAQVFASVPPPAPGSREEAVLEAAKMLATGQDTKGLRPRAVQLGRSWLAQHGMVPISPKEGETLDSTITLLNQLRNVTQLIAQSKTQGVFSTDSIMKAGVAGGTFDALKSLLSKRAFAEAGMLTNQDIQRAGRLLPWSAGGYSYQQWLPGMLGRQAIVDLIQLRKFLESSVYKMYERKYGMRDVFPEGGLTKMSEQGNLPDVGWEQNGSPDPNATGWGPSYWDQLLAEAEAEMKMAEGAVGRQRGAAGQPSSQEDAAARAFADRVRQGKTAPEPQMGPPAPLTKPQR